MKEKIKKYLKEGLILVALIFIASNALSYYRSLDLNKEDLKYQSFTLLDQSRYQVAKSKPILIHFWATWCPTCKFEAPNIQKISQEYEVITIAVQSGSNEEVQNYLKANNLSFKVVNDQSGELSKAFNIKAFPTTFIYNKDLKLAFTEVGYTTTAGLKLRLSVIE